MSTQQPGQGTEPAEEQPTRSRTRHKRAGAETEVAAEGASGMRYQLVCKPNAINEALGRRQRLSRSGTEVDDSVCAMGEQ